MFGCFFLSLDSLHIMHTIATSPTIHLFAYGSLTFEHIWLEVTGKKNTFTTAFIANIARKKLMNKPYPGGIKTTGLPPLQGTLYFNLTTQQIERLDNFEGELYLRERHEVTLENGTKEHAHIYLIKNEYRSLVSDEDWELADFATWSTVPSKEWI